MKEKGQMKVLLVQAPGQIRDQITGLITGRGHEVVQATTYDEVLQHIGGSNVVLTDPDGLSFDGIDLIDRLRKQGRKDCMLVISERDTWNDKVAAFDVGADDYLAKPFQTEELIARLKALARRSC
jgi:two-component system OmpR family response regulator